MRSESCRKVALLRPRQRSGTLSSPWIGARRHRVAQLPRRTSRIRQAVPLPDPGVSGVWSERRLRRASDGHAQASVAPFLDAIGVDRVDIVGNSMGGGVGINFAIHHADRVGKLVTIGGIGTNIFSPGPSEGIRLLQEFTEDPTRQRLVDWLDSMVYNQAARHGRTDRGALEAGDRSRDAGFRPPDVRQGGIRPDDVDDEDVRRSDAVVADA